MVFWIFRRVLLYKPWKFLRGSLDLGNYGHEVLWILETMGLRFCRSWNLQKGCWKLRKMLRGFCESFEMLVGFRKILSKKIRTP
jgi:hypothetical protein